MQIRQHLLITCYWAFNLVGNRWLLFHMVITGAKKKSWFPPNLSPAKSSNKLLSLLLLQDLRIFYFYFVSRISRMPQVFTVLRCYSCNVFQVHSNGQVCMGTHSFCCLECLAVGIPSLMLSILQCQSIGT